MSWVEIRLDISPTVLESISGYLFALGCEGIYEKDKDIYAYFSVGRWSEEVRLALVQYLQQALPSFSARKLRIVQVADKDWNKKWKENFTRQRITHRVVVQPPWESYPEQEGEVVLVINPKMAFGTGYHESTKLLIVLIDQLVTWKDSFLDVGTGSGILAILARKLGANPVVGIDIDPVAIDNALENAQLNGVSDQITFYTARLEHLPVKKYSCIAANINRNVLEELAEIFPKYIKDKGKLLLSGLLLTDQQQIVQQYKRQNFHLIKKMAMKEWLALVFEWRKPKEVYAKRGD